MATNSYFKTNEPRAQEWDLQQDLSDECIQIHGYDVYYCPRIMMSSDQLYGESQQNKCTAAHLIEMLQTNANGWNGGHSSIAAIGYMIEDSATLLVSKRRFTQEVCDRPSITGRTEETIQYPRNGDWIYIPMFQQLFEIKDVKIDPQNLFRPKGNTTVYEIEIAKAHNSHTFFSTGIPEIDRINLTRKADNSGNDITKEGGADNLIIEAESNGSLDSLFGDKTVVVTTPSSDPSNPNVVRLNRGSGAVDFKETNANVSLLDDFNKY